jgi:aminobutyraldehyde dehydrogenase
VDRAVAAAAAAFPAWSETTPAERSLLLLRLADRIEGSAEELAGIEARNVGKPIRLARSEIPFIVDNLRFFAGAARCLEGRAAGEYQRGYTSWIRREPLGVIGSIAPWNYPLMMAAWKIGPALATGNTVVLKPSEQTPLSALRLAELAADLFPPGVLNVITGHGEPVGAAIVRDPRVALVSLTGDVGTGKKIAAAASASLKRVHLELGGKAPVLVFDDADLEQVVRVLRTAGFVNSGQDCTAACRVYAAGPVYDRLLGDLVPAVRSLRIGDILDEETELGPMVTSAQRQRVAGFVDRAAKGGAEVLTGGGAAGRPRV